MEYLTADFRARLGCLLAFLEIAILIILVVFPALIVFLLFDGLHTAFIKIDII